MTTLTVCIFSFNRAKYLTNCVDSVRHCLPEAKIVIFDDNSDDSETLDFLKSITRTCQVVKPSKVGKIKHGGLYHNMNSALEIFKKESLLCFLQDDTQMVRPVSNTELENIEALFTSTPSLGFIHPCFIRGIDLKKSTVTPLPGPTNHFFYRQDAGQSAGIHYSDLVIFKPQRLVAANWYFKQSEPANDQQAKKIFGMMAYMWLPIAMWLPEVPAYRGKKKTLGLRLAEKKKRVGFYPFEILNINKDEFNRQYEILKLPVAEEFLRCKNATPPHPWTYNPLTGLWLLKQINNLEVALRCGLKHRKKICEK